MFEEASKALSVIVPAYNEEFRLPGTLQETIRCYCLGPHCCSLQKQIQVSQPLDWLTRAGFYSSEETKEEPCPHMSSSSWMTAAQMALQSKALPVVADVNPSQVLNSRNESCSLRACVRYHI